jgi:hypothetical protein
LDIFLFDFFKNFPPPGILFENRQEKSMGRNDHLRSQPQPLARAQSHRIWQYHPDHLLMGNLKIQIFKIFWRQKKRGSKM